IATPSKKPGCCDDSQECTQELRGEQKAGLRVRERPLKLKPGKNGSKNGREHSREDEPGQENKCFHIGKSESLRAGAGFRGWHASDHYLAFRRAGAEAVEARTINSGSTVMTFG